MEQEHTEQTEQQTTALEPTNKTGRKRDELTLLEDRTMVARLMHEGITSARDIQFRINLGRKEPQCVSVTTIQNDINWIKESWKKSIGIDYQAYINQVLDELSNLKRICFEEFNKSKTPKITTEGSINVSKKDDIDVALGIDDDDGEDGEKPKVKLTKVKEEQREGNVAYLQMIERIIERQCKILGMDAPSKIALTNAKGEDVIGVKEDILSTLASMNEASSRTTE